MWASTRLAGWIMAGLAMPGVAMQAAHAQAQDYPSRPVTLVVPYTPGGAVDIVARLLGQKLADRLGQPFIIENRPGAGTVIGASTVAKSLPEATPCYGR